jgi:hypothetical protein
MTSSGRRPKPLPPSAVKQIIDEALGDEGSYAEAMSMHSRFDHLERRIDFNDVLFGLNRPWEACKADGFDDENWQWKYKIITQDIDERVFTIVLRLDSRNKKFHVITRYPND